MCTIISDNGKFARFFVWTKETHFFPETPEIHVHGPEAYETAFKNTVTLDAITQIIDAFFWNAHTPHHQL